MPFLLVTYEQNCESSFETEPDTGCAEMKRTLELYAVQIVNISFEPDFPQTKLCILQSIVGCIAQSSQRTDHQ